MKAYATSIHSFKILIEKLWYFVIKFWKNQSYSVRVSSFLICSNWVLWARSNFIPVLISDIKTIVAKLAQIFLIKYFSFKYEILLAAPNLTECLLKPAKTPIIWINTNYLWAKAIIEFYSEHTTNSDKITPFYPMIKLPGERQLYFPILVHLNFECWKEIQTFKRFLKCHINF